MSVSRGQRGRSPYYQLIDDWLHDNFDGEILPHLQYAETIQAYINQFGIENVHVFLFEDLIADHDRFFRQICDVMGIGAEEGIRLVREKIDNSRWTTRQVEALEHVVGSGMKSLFFRLASRKTRRKLLGLDQNGKPVVAGGKALAPISPEWQKHIFETTQQGNLWLQESYGLPLREVWLFRYTGAGMSALEKGLILHVGLEKTGTTTIQKSFFATHPEIYYIGKYVRKKIPKGCLSQEIYNFMNPLIWNISRPLDVR